MEYSCLRPVRGREFGAMEVNPDKYYRVAVTNRFKICSDDGKPIHRPRPHSAMQPALNGSPFLEYDIDAVVSFDACIVQKAYSPRPETYAHMLDSIGPRKTFRLGSKVFEAVSGSRNCALVFLPLRWLTRTHCPISAARCMIYFWDFSTASCPRFPAELRFC